MTTIPTGLPTLSAGAHQAGEGKACVMEYVALLAGEPWTDRPVCTHPVLALAAQSVNDSIRDEHRHLLVPLIGRLFGTGIEDMAESLRVTVALANWSRDRAAKSAKSAEYAAKYAVYAAEYAAEYAESAAESAAEYAAKYAAVSAAEYAAKYAAEYAAKYAEYAAEYAAVYAAKYAAARVAFLSALIDEYDRLTGRTECRQVTDTELTDLAALVG